MLAPFSIDLFQRLTVPLHFALHDGHVNKLTAKFIVFSKLLCNDSLEFNVLGLELVIVLKRHHVRRMFNNDARFICIGHSSPISIRSDQSTNSSKPNASSRPPEKNITRPS